MAEKSRTKVAVVEGDYAELCGLGLPLPLSLQLVSEPEFVWCTMVSQSFSFWILCQPLLANSRHYPQSS